VLVRLLVRDGLREYEAIVDGVSVGTETLNESTSTTAPCEKLRETVAVSVPVTGGERFDRVRDRVVD
jgi:hypothetical protein